MRDDFQEILDLAQEAGKQAGLACKPIPMVVGMAVGLTNEIDITKPQYFVEDGACGFAWVKMKPANHPFVKWAIDSGHARRNEWEGGASISISAYNQSVQRKEAHAHAMAKVLREAAENGILAGLSKRELKIWSESRLD